MLAGSQGDDVVQGGLGHDSLEGNEGNDTLRGDTGNDLIDGGSGTDIAVYRFDAATAGVSFNASAVLINSTSLSTLADGLGGTDTLTNIERIGVVGSAFADSINGSAGDDQIEGAAGNDVIYGGPGFDTFVYRPLAGAVGNDVIADFGVDSGRIVIEGLTLAEVTGTNMSGGLTAGQVWFESLSATETMLHVGTNATAGADFTITLQQMQPGTFGFSVVDGNGVITFTPAASGGSPGTGATGTGSSAGGAGSPISGAGSSLARVQPGLPETDGSEFAWRVTTGFDASPAALGVIKLEHLLQTTDDGLLAARFGGAGEPVVLPSQAGSSAQGLLGAAGPVLQHWEHAHLTGTL